MVKSEQRIQSQPSKTTSSSSPSSPPSPNSYKIKKFKGVRMRSWGSWVSEIRAPNQKTRIWLGSYSTPEAAARAYDAALLCLKGSSANLNFPINPNSYQIPTEPLLLSPKSIQRVAAAAAANVPVSSNPPPPTSISSSSSPSMTSSSFSNQIEESIVLDPNSNSYYDYSMANSEHSYYDYSMANSEHWYDFDTLHSPKYADPMMGSMFFNPPSMVSDDYLYEEGDIRLWNFC